MVTNDKILGIAGLNTLDILNNRYEPVKTYSTKVEPQPNGGSSPSPLNIALSSAGGLHKLLNISGSIAGWLHKLMNGSRDGARGLHKMLNAPCTIAAYLHKTVHGCCNATAYIQGRHAEFAIPHGISISLYDNRTRFYSK